MEFSPDRSQHVPYGSHTAGPVPWPSVDDSHTLRAQRVPGPGPLIRVDQLDSLSRRLFATPGSASRRWIRTSASMTAECDEQGFVRSRRAGSGDADDSQLAAVKDPLRWSELGFDGDGSIDGLGVECFRPSA